MRRALQCWWAIAVILFATTSPLHAHDPYDSFSTATLHADRVEVIVTMAQSTALRLIDREMKARALTFENFPTHRARLEQEAAALYVLTARGKSLASRSAEAILTDENDVVLKAVFPRPPSGPLHFHAAFLKKLGNDYGGILEARDTTGTDLGWEQLSFENPDFQITILPAPKK